MSHPPSLGRRLLAVAAALASFAVIPPSHADIQAPAPPSPAPVGAGPAAGTAGGPRTITLITGDRVVVGPAGTVSVLTPAGTPARAHVTTAGPDTYVYPDSAVPYVSAGLLDRRLFDVTRLLGYGYDDAHVDHLPLIVTYKESAAGLRAQRAPEGVTDVRALSSVNGAAWAADRGRAAEFWAALTGAAAASTPRGRAREPEQARAAAPSLAAGIAKVWLDGKVKADLSDSVAQIGAPGVWAGGDTGQGVDVAVLDTGVDAGHPDLSAQVAESVSFVPGEDATDRHGHGTHVASTVAGTGAASGGEEKGVAPGARLHIGKVLSDEGQGQDSWIIAGMQWAARDAHAKVISMSLGGDSPGDGTDPMSQAVDELSAETGALFVIAAGNAGLNGDRTVASPGAADAALTVGAVDGADQLADFSSRGPRLVDDALKPDITAPGVDILAARSQYSPRGEGQYLTLSGTSMATPHVAGSAALLAAEHPDWTGQRLKDALMSSAKLTPGYGPYQAGTGRVDVAAATRAAVVATGSAYLGIHSPTKEPDARPEGTLTYTNTGDAPVTLDLSFDGSGLPAGLWSLSASRVEIPAHGESTVTVAADLSRAEPQTTYGGQVLAKGSDGAVVAHSVVGVSTGERPSRLTVTATGRDGEPMPGLISMMREGDPAGLYYSFVTFSGQVSALLPNGTYSVWMWGDVRGTHGPDSLGMALLSAPTVVVDGDATLKLDGSALREVKAVTPKESAGTSVRVDYHRTLGDTASVTDSVAGDTVYDSVWTNPTAKPAAGQLSVTARWRRTQPPLSVANGADSYDDLWLQPGGGLLPEGTSKVDAVFAGGGAPADYAGIDAKGKVAVVRYGDTDVQVPAAVGAGVKLLLIVNDEPGRLREPLSRTPLTVASLTKDEGERLIAQLGHGRVRLQVTSHPVTDYLYDLVRTWSGTVPADLTYAPAQRDLARVEVDFRNDAADEVDEYRYDLSPGLTAKVGTTQLSRSKGHRTDWVTPARWMSEAEVPRESIQYGGGVSYQAGQTVHEQWFGPIQRPRINDAVSAPLRDGDTLEVEVPGWGDSGANHAGLAVPGELSQKVSLSQGGTPVAETEGSYLYAGLRPGRLDYALTTTTERDPAVYPYSVKTSTTWRFTSRTAEPGRPARLPLIQLDYGVDTDAAGRASRSAKLTLTPSHLPGGPGSGTIRTVGLAVSYDDGATWHEQRLDRKGDGWTTTLHAPGEAVDLTLRATAADTAGNGVEQTVVRALGLK
ncbi:S8 family serine peptidase [Microbispora sp. RL4-1S]|uniref:S8 family serine peptidase n=1 Tax=Microbispora oryzae TaxID=2806554 RepID=A0A941AM54_9ACTN|nr:S8 family serine peptidase [Microbispora oryzae]MBP2706978.1 S8 family serine peptidase [Microbispora oryzae]